MIKYYEDNRISQSQLKLFINPNLRSLHRPKNEKEFYYEREKIHFSLGKLLDVLLEGGDINDYFYVEDEGYKRPTEVVDSICQQAQDETEANQIASFETVNRVRIEHGYQKRWKDEDKIRDWYESLKHTLELKDRAKNLTIITYEEYLLCVKMRDAILEGKYTSPILQEISGEYQVDLYTKDLKCLIDYLQLDHKRKLFRVIDFKTTEKYLESFSSAILKFRYDIQLSFYTYIVSQLYPKYRALDPVIIAVSKKEPEYAEPFTLSQTVIKNARFGFVDKLSKYHPGWEGLLTIANKYNQEMYNTELINKGTNYIDEL